MTLLNDPDGRCPQRELGEDLTPIPKPAQEGPMREALRDHNGVAWHQVQRRKSSIP